MERIYLVVFDRRGIGSRRRLEGKHLLPTSPPPEAASSTPNLSLPPLCSGSVASTADSRNVRCRANCSSTPDPAPPLSPRNWLTSLFPTTTTLAPTDVQPGAAEYHCNRVQLSPLPPSIIPYSSSRLRSTLVDVPSFVARFHSFIPFI